MPPLTATLGAVQLDCHVDLIGTCNHEVSPDGFNFVQRSKDSLTLEIKSRCSELLKKMCPATGGQTDQITNENNSRSTGGTGVGAMLEQIRRQKTKSYTDPIKCWRQPTAAN